MKISLITVVYNNERTIADAIESILNQNVDNFSIEYIIIDGASVDRTLEIINTYKNHISVVVSEPDEGIYHAMNKGIKMATGDVIGILNSDDFYNDYDVIKNIFTQFNENIGIDVVYGNLYYVDKYNTDKIIRYWQSKQYHNLFFESGEVPPHPSFFVRRRVYEKVGYFDTNFRLAADYDLMFRILKVHKLNSFFLNKIIVKMRLGGETNKNYKNIYLGNKEIFKIWKKYNCKIPFSFFLYRFFKKIIQLLK